ncbi:MAG: cysteine--1-D-myo-inosityl 2-amino-2-deoxy-alpha-D-glucopyranoside ligase [Renibacterium sp.]|nr:cysteine--1-D-myo-inosityl 2-amino-2-deoxy-alpha-D-glucopyranoside ligase [Renibacterium sp.]
MKSWSTRPRPELPGRLDGLALFDTVEGALLPLPTEGAASLYVCGITPYDATHMGHAATYLAFDLLGRAWRDAGVQVSFVQNTTDVDDPLLERAARDGVDWRDLAAQQIELFRTDLTALNIIAPEHYIGVVEAIEWIVPAVEELVAGGFAYRLDGGDVYFDVAAASTAEQVPVAQGWWLGQISRLSEAQMLELSAERGGDPERPGKRHALDPLLWRAERAGEPSWPGASLGPGRPGWHIECTVIARKFLPAPFTVQGGGSDLVFPHHEMGAGHAWALDGTPLARRYAHTGMVGLDGEKMSKSKGNLVLVSALRAQGVDPMAIRLAMLANHYRTDWSWTEQLLAAAQTRLIAWRQALATAPVGSGMPLLAELRAALAGDLDAPAALAAVDRWADSAAEPDAPEGDPAEAQLVADAIESLLGVVLR